MMVRPILLDDGVARIPLGVNAKDGYAVVELQDIPLVSGKNWRFDGRYASSDIDGKKVRMHSMIITSSKGYDVDHINGDPLDNRRSNLRVLTHADNVRNRRSAKGCYYDKNANKWRAQITINRREVWLGSFQTQEEAREAYLRSRDNSITELSR